MSNINALRTSTRTFSFSMLASASRLILSSSFAMKTKLQFLILGVEGQSAPRRAVSETILPTQIGRSLKVLC